MVNFKKAISFEGANKKVQDFLGQQSEIAKAAAKGIAGDKIVEAVPEFLSTPSENVMTNENNAWIILGRDRSASRMSGYGGKGDTQCASIDIVAGRMGSEVKAYDESGDSLFVNPSFKKDAARIYISQKTDIDKYFDLAAGKVGNAKSKSGVGIKADNVRIIGRESIKFVTTTDKKNSQGGDIKSVLGIDLIAGNDDSDLQSMVKGENLVEGISELVDHMDNLTGVVDTLLMAQFEFNEAISSHFHSSPFFAAPTLPSEVLMSKGIRTMISHLQKTKASLLKQKINLGLFKQNYLSKSGGKYINSRFNSVN
jgi:hypothetical protein|tara:strand:+ start:955 stop:1887 length:933 start_codon:yes stop_codon:yes gene_type:complete